MEKKKIEYVIFDADNLIDKLIGYKCCDNVELLKGTKEFILDFYNALENYRITKQADEIVVSVSTVKNEIFLHAYERLLCLLNSNEKIVFGNGYCNYKGKRALVNHNSLNDYSDYIIDSVKNGNYKISAYYNDLRYLGLDNVIIIGDYTYGEFNREFKNIENEYRDFQKESYWLKNAGEWEKLEILDEDFYQSSKCKLFVFLSHSHDDLQYTMGLISFLRKQYNVYVYIDSEDRSLPLRTSIKTAQVIKKKIKKCDRFIFLASNGAIDSKWCNWELGMGDVQKLPDNLAFLAWHDTQIVRQNYKGNEYMEIYPFMMEMVI